MDISPRLLGKAGCKWKLTSERDIEEGYKLEGFRNTEIQECRQEGTKLVIFSPVLTCVCNHF